MLGLLNQSAVNGQICAVVQVWRPGVCGQGVGRLFLSEAGRYPSFLFVFTACLLSMFVCSDFLLYGRTAVRMIKPHPDDLILVSLSLWRSYLQIRSHPEILGVKGLNRNGGTVILFLYHILIIHLFSSRFIVRAQCLHGFTIHGDHFFFIHLFLLPSFFPLTYLLVEMIRRKTQREGQTPAALLWYSGNLIHTSREPRFQLWIVLESLLVSLSPSPPPPGLLLSPLFLAAIFFFFISFKLDRTERNWGREKETP